MWFAATGTPPVPGGGGMSSWLVALIAALGVLATAAATAYGIRRLNSGGIKTSTAESLWNESNDMRKELGDRLEKAEAKADALTKEVEMSRQEAIAARQEAIQWQQKALQMEADTDRMKKQIATLQRQVRDLRKSR